MSSAILALHLLRQPRPVDGCSYFHSNPQRTVVGGGATASITRHSDTGLPGGAVIEANVSVPNACDAPGEVVITVTSTGYKS